ncbi:MAG: cytochrome P460 family protein [Granulosicoccus sp.]
MKKAPLLQASVIVTVTSLLAGCASLTAPLRDADPRWADYKDWTRVTADEVSTGDPTGVLGGVHMGNEGYREVYVNDIAKDTLYGSAPYNYPAGSVIVKEQYASKADWEAGRKPAHTVSVKVAASDTSEKKDWMWADSFKGKAKESEFCAGCHSIAELRGNGDFVFTNGDFLKTQQ